MTKSALPPQQEQEGTMYSESDVEHIVARRVMSHRLDDFERGHMSLVNQVKESNAKIEASLINLDKSLDKHYEHVTECREDLRGEIERDFVSKLDFMTEMSKLEGKVDRQWIKITTAVSVVLLIAGIVIKVIGIA